MTATIKISSDVMDVLKQVAKRIPTGYEMMDSPWQNCEAETLVWQTIHAMVINHKKHGEAFSWVGPNARAGRQSCGTDNGAAFDRLVSEGCFEEGKRDGKPIVCVTRKCLDIVIGHLAMKGKS